MNTLNETEVQQIHAYWQAANYLAAGQIYLQANPLLKEPLKAEDIKPRLLGHWGTSPGLNLIYVHLNRLIKKTDADIIYICGPGHGAPAIIAHTYLEGTYSELYPEVTPDEKGMARLFRQFSTPGGIPSHVGAHTPGSIHEGGELGYSMVHAFGAVLDNPDLIAACVVGDGEAETCPLEGSWKSINFLNPVRDGAVLPILHLNGYKISGPTVLARFNDMELTQLFCGYGYNVLFVTGDNPTDVHYQLADALEEAYRGIREIQHHARIGGVDDHAQWPMIILRTPKGWTGPKEWDGLPIEGTFRSHQVPLTGVREDAAKLAYLESWMKSYQPERLFDEHGRLLPEVAELAPAGHKRMSAQPFTNAGLLLKDLQLPPLEKYAVNLPAPGVDQAESTRNLGKYIRDVFLLNASTQNFRLFCPDETSSNRLEAVFEVTDRCFMEKKLPNDISLSANGRVMEVLSEHLCEGWLEGYLLTGRHGLFPCYEAFVTIVDSMVSQHAKWLKTARELPWRKPVASLNYLLTSHVWRQDNNGYSHQGPGFIDTIVNKKSAVARIYLPPDANTLLSVMDHCLRSHDYINVIVAGKQPELQWLNLADAIKHAAQGASAWDWAGNSANHTPDIVLACAGDVPTLETVAAAWLLRRHLPELKVRVVNVIDLMALSPRAYHPHGMSDELFSSLFTNTTHVIFAFHGYVRIIHDLVHGRPDPTRFHVRGYMEEGTTTTPFDMVVLNEMSRYHLAMEAVRRASIAQTRADAFLEYCQSMLHRHRQYICQHLDDMPEVKDWKWASEL
ncbi:MAG TPA: phosphoketolase family protein [Mucilaginibacter sp.]|jgi:xylulose-5-phosphate/fructose-6-phosphate phosphoketolase|nr:phosphoketolase family protein [Mucilaginibacter sp.]